MPAPVELALASLLPMVSFLAPELITLSNSMLAQSRAKAASLKPEEEIARTYACCHIACERLKKRLDLEIGRPAPPVKPRVYDKLFKYLDGVLTTPVTPKRTKVKDVTKTTGVESSTTPATATKRTRDVPGEFPGAPTTGSKRSRIEAEKENENEETPGFVKPMIRVMCQADGAPSAAQHVLVGATSVVREIVSRNSRRAADDFSSKRRRRTPQSGKSASSTAVETSHGTIAIAKWPGLLVALYLVVVAKMRGLELEDSEMNDHRKISVDAVQKFCTNQENNVPEDAIVSMSQLQSNTGFYILEAEDYGWLEMEWYHNVPAGVGDADQEDRAGEDKSSVDEHEDMPTTRKRPYKTPLQRKEKHGGKAATYFEDDPGASGLLPGLGTMFQSGIDWLSEERMKNFAQWKKGILSEINAIEANA